MVSTMTLGLARSFLGDSPRLRRQVQYWALTLGIYLACVLLLAVEVATGAADARAARWLSLVLVAGPLLWYLPLRASEYLGLSPAVLALLQAVFAIACIVAAYAVIGPARGSTLAILLVVMVFCAFTLTPHQAHALTLYALLLLGATMLAMNRLEPERYETGQEVVHFTLAAIMLGAVSFLTGQLSLLRQRLKAQKAELAEALARIQELATRDDLTLLANRRHMNELLAYEMQRHQRKDQTLCLALIDIDHFKRVNDTYGHAAGDEALRQFAREAQCAIRSTDILARWGGEEFLLLLPDTELGAATQVLSRIQGRIAALRVAAGASNFGLTLSAGLTASRRGAARPLPA
ncbi:MAG TPA: diguanylate cyclase [Burkholderiaceae bacterium]|nr:diguanylate cyclase [Burkholderiaceae bacterium]